ncbi:hypothetical protein EV702DRAFT_982227 [Suillus placidus]|uniref:Uncharacterized protein n=1 Tax=Suillus placidus TaxID=48579 RepID=A0A9P6ZG68_9AGAM|nr:hypothetical protein EV702DRAFT_982227 [Suillus placidus]
MVCASLPSLNDTSIHTLDSSGCPSCNTRTLWHILLSCGLTLFACTWTAIHTNIPTMGQGKVSFTYYRMVYMVMGLIAPEVIITWAAEEFFSARWTMTHGFFAWMGGFMLHVNGRPRATLTPDELLQFVRDGSVDMPVISEEEIEDRSKGDGLSKGIALLQLVWFAIQFFARYINNLPNTLLETDALAIAALTCISYGLWWKKPKDVRCPYIVHWKAAASPSRLTNEYADSSRSSPVDPIAEEVRPSAVRSRRLIFLGDHGTRSYVLSIGCFSVMVFGGIHCLGWNYLTQGGATIWRVASLMTVSAPVLFYLGTGYQLHADRPFDSALMTFVTCAAPLGLITYVIARAILVAFIIMSLIPPLPPGVYDTVAWTTYIPHFQI